MLVHQKRLEKKRNASLNPLAVQDNDSEEEHTGTQEEVVIPVAMRPFLNKEINFQVFLDLLSEKVDPQRVSISLKEFREIEFGRCGIPNIVIRLFSVLSQETEEQIIDKKIEQAIPEYAAVLKPNTLENKIKAINDQISEIESTEIRNCRGNFARHINFYIFESFFRTFCKNKYAESDY